MTTLDKLDREMRVWQERQRVANLPARYLLWLWAERQVLGICSLHGPAQPAGWCSAIHHPMPWRRGA